MTIREFLYMSAFAGLLIVLLAAGLLSTPAMARECGGQWLVSSHYGRESGSRTADGSFFDGSQMVAAHRSWKFGTKLRVSYHGRSVLVTVRDRGPFIRWRSLDLSTAAARKIGLTKRGVDRVCVERLG